METTTAMPRRKLRSFHDLTKSIGDRQRPKQRKEMREAQDYAVLQTDITSDLNYFVLSLPKNLPDEEKMQRLSLLAADKVMDSEGSDIICMAIWEPSEV
jgi:hypothetical protein